MGGLTTFASTAIQALGAASTIAGAIESRNNNSSKAAYDQAKAQAVVNAQAAAQNAADGKEQIRLSAEQADSERRAALRRIVAKQRASFGASGIGSDGGSQQAVLLGLFEESEEERARRAALDTLKSGIIDRNAAQTQRINTLQLAQLKERTRIGNVADTLQMANTIGSTLF